MSSLLSSFRHVNFLWDDAHAAGLDPVDRLVYRSNLLGSDGRVTNTGGGNTSSKVMETDVFSGQPVEVLWVKGSGGDLRTAKRENFSSLYQDSLLSLQDLYAEAPDRGLKAPAEDRMVGMYAHCTFNLNPRPSRALTPRCTASCRAGTWTICTPTPSSPSRPAGGART